MNDSRSISEALAAESQDELILRVVKPLRYGERWVDGAVAGARLRRIAERFPAAAYTSFVRLLTAAAELAERDNDRPREIADAASGHREEYPVWAMLVGSDGARGPAILDALRGLILFESFRAAERAERTSSNSALRARAAIEKLERPLHSDRLELLQKFANALDNLIAQMGTGDSADEIAKALAATLHELSEMHLAGMIRDNPRSEFERVIRHFSGQPVRASVATRPARSATSPPRPQPGGPRPISFRPPKTYRPDRDEPPDTSICVQDVGDAKQPLVAARLEAQRSQYLIAWQLLSDGDHTLRPEESKRAFQWLVQQAQSAIAANRWAVAQACTLWLLSLATTRGSSDLAQARIADSISGDGLHLSPDFRSWSTVVPNAERFFKPPDGMPVTAESTLFRFWIPVPDPLPDLIIRARGPRGDQVSSLLTAQLQDIQESYASLKAEIRRTITPRFSEGRARFSMLTALHTQTAEPVLSQILAGDTLGQTTSPQHYYSISHGRFVSGYCAALTNQLGIEAIAAHTNHPSDQRIGAPITAYPGRVYSDLVKALRDDIVAAATKSSLHDRPRLRCNAITRYSAHMLIAAVAHRATGHISGITLLDIDPNGWIGLHDKQMDLSTSLRISALPDTLIKQLQVLRQVQLETADDLSREGHASPSELNAATWLRDAAAGKSPLFVWLAGDGTPRQMTRDDLLGEYYKAKGLPGNLLRSRTRRLLTEAGASPVDVYRQLGHSWNGALPFSEETATSVITFADRMAPLIEGALASDGWQVLPAALSRKRPLVWPVPPALRYDFASAANQERRAIIEDFESEGEGESEGPATELEFAIARVDRFIETVRNEASTASGDRRGVVIAEEQIKRFIDDLEGADITAREATRALDLLRSRVKVLRTTEHWAGAVPPRSFRRRDQPPVVLRTHLVARRRAVLIRSELMRPSKEQRADKEDPRDALGRLATLIAIDGSVPTTEQLLIVIQSIADGRYIDLRGRQHRLCVECSFRNPPLQRTITLGVEASLAALRWVQLPERLAPKFDEVAKSVRRVLSPSTLGGVSGSLLNRLVEIGTLAARIEQPGLLWVRTTGPDPQTLDLDRTTQYLSNTAGAESMAAAVSDADASGGDADDLFHYHAPTVASVKTLDLKLALQQFRKVTGQLHSLTEQGERQNIDHRRYTKAAELLRSFAEDPEVDQNVAMVASFACTLVDSSERKIGTVYNYLTSFGRRLLLFARGQALTEFESHDLESLFLDMIPAESRDEHPSTQKTGRKSAGKSSETRSKIAWLAIRFYQFHRDSLPDIDTSALGKIAGSRLMASPRVVVVTDRESDLAISIIDGIRDRAGVSADENRQLKLWFTLLKKLGLRTDEPLGIRVRDLYLTASTPILRIGNSPIGLVKFRNSTRSYFLQSVLDLEEIQALLSWHDLRTQDVDPNRPLFAFSSPVRTKELANLLLAILKAVSAGKAHSLHALRHTVASRLLLQEVEHAQQSGWPSGPTTSRFMGQHRKLVAIEHYWHLAHLALVHISQRELTSDALGVLLGEDGSAARHRKRRSGQAAAGTVDAGTSEPATSGTLVPALADQVLRAARIQPEHHLALLKALCLFESPERALASVRNDTRTLEITSEVLTTLAFERATLLLRPDAISAVCSAANRRWTLPPHRLTQWSETGLAIRSIDHRLLREILDRVSPGDDLELLLNASLLSSDRRSPRMRALLSTHDWIQQFDAGTLPLVVASALITRRYMADEGVP